MNLETAAERNAACEPNPLPVGWFAAQGDRPSLFSEVRYWVSEVERSRMAQAIIAIDTVLNSPAYQHGFAQRFQLPTPSAGRTPGVLYGYDFHLHPSGPKLIEVNTNAGGAFLNAALGEAWQEQGMDAACAPTRARLVEMFVREWQTVQPGQNRPAGWLVVVDEQPESQYLYPEFELCRQWLADAGWQVGIADPSELHWAQGRLTWQGNPVDMVYNRLTDFYLETPATAALKQAYDQQAVLVTPAPDAHGRMADKRHLMTLADADFLASVGVSPAHQAAILDVLPACQVVRPEAAEALWAARKNAFFKPVAGFGSRATYRGDKLTKRVFDEILAGDYIMQALVPPSERTVVVDGVEQMLKVDVRNYAYQGEVLGLAARLYQGQTTNFRTPGGGFAPVYCVPS